MSAKSSGNTRAATKTRPRTTKKWVYLFTEGTGEMRDLLGGKGAGGSPPQGRGQVPGRALGPGHEGPPGGRAPDPETVRRPGQPAARERAVRRQDRHAGADGQSP